MTNTAALEARIKGSGIKKSWLAEKMGLSPTALWKKLRGEREFKISEVQTMCDLLGIDSMEEVAKIFFA